MKQFFKLLCVLFLSTRLIAEDEGKLPEAERYFLSGVFDSYHSQLTSYVTESVKIHPDLMSSTADGFMQEMQCFINHVLTPIKNTSEAKKIYHRKMLQTMRGLIIQGNALHKYNEAMQFLGELSEWMYVGVDLWTSENKFIFELLPENFLSHSKSVASMYKEAYQLIQKESGFVGKIYKKGKDPHMQGDLPSYLFDYDKTKVIRTPLVITDDDWEDAKRGEYPEINEEFKQFLRCYSEQGKVHLYINLLQNNIKEKHAAWVIQDLENDPKIQKGIIVVRLDKNSSFYVQKNAPKQENSQKFMSAFFAHLTGLDYTWSHHLQMLEWQESLQIIISEVYHEHFQPKELLSISDRQLFIDLLNLKIITTLIDRFHPASANISCSCSVDRGPTTYLPLYLIQSGFKLTEDEKQTSVTMLLAPGLLGGNRLFYPSRLERMHKIIEAISK